MTVEVFYFDGCPNHEALLPHLLQLLSAAGSDADIELVRVADTDQAVRQRFLGSPTVRWTVWMSSPALPRARTTA